MHSPTWPIFTTAVFAGKNLFNGNAKYIDIMQYDVTGAVESNVNSVKWVVELLYLWTSQDVF